MKKSCKWNNTVILVTDKGAAKQLISIFKLYCTHLYLGVDICYNTLIRKNLQHTGKEHLKMFNNWFQIFLCVVDQLMVTISDIHWSSVRVTISRQHSVNILPIQSTEKHFIKSFYIVGAQHVSNAVAYFMTLEGHVEYKWQTWQLLKFIQLRDHSRNQSHFGWILEENPVAGVMTNVT